MYVNKSNIFKRDGVKSQLYNHVLTFL